MLAAILFVKGDDNDPVKRNTRNIASVRLCVFFIIIIIIIFLQGHSKKN